MMENSINSKQTIKSKEISIKNNSNNTINQRFQQYLNHFQEEFIRKVFNQTVNKTNAIKDTSRPWNRCSFQFPYKLIFILYKLICNKIIMMILII